MENMFINKKKTCVVKRMINNICWTSKRMIDNICWTFRRMIIVNCRLFAVYNDYIHLYYDIFSIISMSYDSVSRCLDEVQHII